MFVTIPLRMLIEPDSDELSARLGWDATLALLAGVIAVLTGWRRNDWTVWLGLVAISCVVLAQTALSLWD